MGTAVVLGAVGLVVLAAAQLMDFDGPIAPLAMLGVAALALVAAAAMAYTG